jgi:hypothetical protein
VAGCCENGNEFSDCVKPGNSELSEQLLISYKEPGVMEF